MQVLARITFIFSALLSSVICSVAVADTIKLGAAVSATGKYSTSGSHTKNGYDLAVKVINQKGGVTIGGKKYQIEVLYYDDESTPARGAQLAERLIKQDGIKYMLGPYSSGLTTAMAPVTEQYKIPMVEANGASRSLFNKGYKYLFAVLSTSEQYLQEAINLAAQQATASGRKVSSLKVAIATENDPFSQDVRDGVLDDAKRHGMKVIIDDKLPRDLNDMSATLVKVKALKPDILVVSGHAKGAALITRQGSEMKIDVPMIASTHCDSANIIDKKNYGNNAEGFLCASQWDSSLSYSDAWFGSASDYAALYKKEYGYEPPYQSAESSAAVLVYVDAFERAQSMDPVKVRDALAATNMATFYGNVDFDESGKNIGKPMVLLQVQNGEYKVVAPTRWASHKLVFPKPKF